MQFSALRLAAFAAIVAACSDDDVGGATPDAEVDDVAPGDATHSTDAPADADAEAADGLDAVDTHDTRDTIETELPVQENPDPPPPYGPPPGTPAEVPEGVAWDIVYVRAPRYGDSTPTTWPEVFDPIRMEPGSDLMLLHPDGNEEVLVDAGDGAVVDPVVSFDGKSVYFARFPDLRQDSLNYQRRDAPYDGADIYVIDLGTRDVTRLTFQEWTPNGAGGRWARDPNDHADGENWLGFGIFNLGPCPLPGGRVMFTSSRNGFLPNKGYTFPNLQLFVMDDDGGNVEQVGHLNLGSALHPTMLADGRIMFASYEAQGLRDIRLWGLWGMWPDGRTWEPLMSAFEQPSAFHFQTQLSDGFIVVDEYYNLNNNGFGTFVRFPSWRPNDRPPFGSADPSDASNPAIQAGWYGDGKPQWQSYPFSPAGLAGLTTFTHGQDSASPLFLGTGEYVGKVTHPAAAPHGMLLMVYSPGPANDLTRPTQLPWYDGGIYLAPGGRELTDPAELQEVRNLPEWNEMMPRPVVPYRDIYGVDSPFELAWVPNDGSKSAWLPKGTPFGLVGTSTFYRRDTSPGWGPARWDKLDPFNTSENDPSANWLSQGADAGRYTSDDIWAVRIIAMEPTSLRSYGPAENANVMAFFSHANERLRILGEVALRKPAGDGWVVDADGNPDTSFLARIPADTPFTFQTLDRNGHVLNVAQTWHQLRPGEVRTDCGGCHAHAHMPLAFEGTAASKPDYPVADFADVPPIDVEYTRDVRPLLERSCAPCHRAGDPRSAGLVLDSREKIGGYDAAWHRLANDSNAEHGPGPVIGNGTWRGTNASRYVRMFQSRRSLLVWKIYGRRLDGWDNDDFPTESVAGDASTLPDGANPNDADLDFVGAIMPPPGSDVPPLSDAEKLTIARWIDLGCPSTTEDEDTEPYGWFQDDLRPTLALSSPRRGMNAGPITELRFGAYDYYSGLDEAATSVVASIAVEGHAAGAELASYFTRGDDHVFTWTLAEPLSGFRATLTVRVKDRAGNLTEVVRSFAAP